MCNDHPQRLCDQELKTLFIKASYILSLCHPKHDPDLSDGICCCKCADVMPNELDVVIGIVYVLTSDYDDKFGLVQRRYTQKELVEFCERLIIGDRG